MLNRPPSLLSASVQRLQARHFREGDQICVYLDTMLNRYPRMRSRYSRPAEPDELFLPTYIHPKDARTCEKCDQNYLVSRERRQEDKPYVRYGTIASANLLIKSATDRDALKHDMNVLCVEMEAAGIMNDFPCLVIRGICDYADSHKNKKWQPYAAAVAAAYMKELLSIIPPRRVLDSETATQSAINVAPARLPFVRLPETSVEQSRMSNKGDAARLESSSISQKDRQSPCPMPDTAPTPQKYSKIRDNFVRGDGHLFRDGFRASVWVSREDLPVDVSQGQKSQHAPPDSSLESQKCKASVGERPLQGAVERHPNRSRSAREKFRSPERRSFEGSEQSHQRPPPRRPHATRRGRGRKISDDQSQHESGGAYFNAWLSFPKDCFSSDPLDPEYGKHNDELSSGPLGEGAVTDQVPATDVLTMSHADQQKERQARMQHLQEVINEICNQPRQAIETSHSQRRKKTSGWSTIRADSKGLDEQAQATRDNLQEMVHSLPIETVPQGTRDYILSTGGNHDGRDGFDSTDFLGEVQKLNDFIAQIKKDQRYRSAS